jgi:hypothetical protein
VSSDGAARDEFGCAVAVSGSTALVGARQVLSGTVGRAYEFALPSGGTGTQVAELTAADARAGDEFGNSVALSGTTALVGSYEDQASPGNGEAYAYTLP